MADQFLGEIRAFPFFQVPVGWASCDGQLLPISQNTALFSIIGTTYGGNGSTTFGLPDLGGASPVQQGQGSGLSLRDLGEMGGSETSTLLTSEMPLHTHTMSASNTLATATQPPGQRFAIGDGIGMYANTGPTVTMSPQATAVNGGSLPHNNMMPFLTLRFCIALQGVFPST